MCICNSGKTFAGDFNSNTTSTGLGRVELNKIEEVGELRSKLSALVEAISILSVDRDRLVSKLMPIIRQVPPMTAPGAIATSPSMTDVGHQLQESIDRIRELSRSLDQLREDAAI